MLLALVLLGSVPTLSVASGSDCAKELRSAGLNLVEAGTVELSLRAGPKNQLTLRRGAQVVLSRDLGPGSCDEAGRAAAVIVERWATSLAPPVVPFDAGVVHRGRAVDAGTAVASPRSSESGGSTERVTAPIANDAGPRLEGDARMLAPPTRASELVLSPTARAAPDAGAAAPAIGRAPDARFVPLPVLDAGAAAPAIGRAPDAPSSPALDAGAAVPGIGRAPDARFVPFDAGAAAPAVGRAPDASSSPALDAGTAAAAIGRAPDAPSSPALDGGASVRAPASPAADAGTSNSTILPAAPGAARIPAERPALDGGVLASTTPLRVTPLPDPLPRGGEGDRFRITVTHLEGLLGGGVAFPSGTSSVVAPVVSADIALVLNRRVRVAVTGLFDFGGTSRLFDEAGQNRGTFTSRGGAVLPSAVFCFDLPVRLCAGVLAGARIVEGQAGGDYVYEPKTKVTGAFALGPSVQLAWLPGAFHLALDLSLLVTPVPPEFKITGLTNIAPVPLAQGLVRLSVGLGSDR